MSVSTPHPILPFRASAMMLDVLSAFAAVGGGEELDLLNVMRRAGRGATGSYACLERLQVAGWITDRWEELDPGEPVRPRRRFYRLSDGGKGEAVRLLDGRRPDWRTAPMGPWWKKLVFRLLDRTPVGE